MLWMKVVKFSSGRFSGLSLNFFIMEPVTLSIFILYSVTPYNRPHLQIFFCFLPNGLDLRESYANSSVRFLFEPLICRRHLKSSSQRKFPLRIQRTKFHNVLLIASFDDFIFGNVSNDESCYVNSNVLHK